METDATVIRLTDMNTSTSTPIAPRILAIAAGLIVIAVLGIGAFSVLNDNEVQVDVATGETDQPATTDNTAQNDGTSQGDDEQPAVIELSMPEVMHGEWRVTDGTPLPADACSQNLVENMGMVASFNEDGFSYFEDSGSFIEVHERADGRIDATFDTSFADSPNESRMIFVLEDDGSLTLEPLDDTFFPEPLSHVRCDG